MIGQFLLDLWEHRPVRPTPSDGVTKSSGSGGARRLSYAEHTYAHTSPFSGKDLTSTGMRLVILGPPAAGKGTQAAKLAERLAVPRLSAEDALQAAIFKATPFGRAARDAGDRQQPISEEILIGCVLERMSEPDVANGFVFDDFPRTLGQARAFDVGLMKSHSKLDAVLELKVVEAALVDRVIHRARLAKAMGMPAQANDNLDDFQTLLDNYRVQAEPLAEHYRSVELLIPVNGLLPVDQVTAQLMCKIRK